MEKTEGGGIIVASPSDDKTKRRKLESKQLETGEKILIVATFTELFLVKIDFSSNEGELIAQVPLPYFGMGIAKFNSKVLLIGGERLPSYSDRENDVFDVGPDNISRRIYELIVENDSNFKIVESSSFPLLNEWKAMPVVETFGGKIYVLSEMPLFTENYYVNHTVVKQNCIFEVFDSSINQWRILDSSFKIVPPLADDNDSYSVHCHYRSGDNMFVNSRFGSVFVDQSFNFNKEIWEMDEYILHSLRRANWNRTILGTGVSVAGLDKEISVILAYTGENVYAHLFSQNGGLLNRQNVSQIFSWLLPSECSDLDYGFFELGNGEICGVVTGWEIFPGKEIPQIVETKDFLFVSVFSLQAVFPDTACPNPTEDLLRVQIMKQIRINTDKLDSNREYFSHNVRGLTFL